VNGAKGEMNLFQLRHEPGLRLLVGVAAALSLTIGMTACGTYEPTRPREPGTTVIISGNRGNMPRPVLSASEDAREVVYEAVRSADMVYIVGVSADPALTASRKYGDEECNSEAACKNDWEAQTARIEEALSATPPAAEEADLVAAVNFAAAQLEHVDGPKNLVIIDNGMSTSGPLDYTNPETFAQNAADHAVNIARNNGLTGLDDVEGVMIGVNNVFAPQERLTLTRQSHVKEFWEAFLLELGATISVHELTLTEDLGPVDGLPEVSVIPPDGPAGPESSTPTATPEQTPSPVVLTAAQLRFVPNEARFRDPGHAREVLQDVAETLMGGAHSAVLTGTTALEDQSGLSQQRAEAVEEVLVALGVDAAKLTTEGVGIAFPCYQDPGEVGTASWDELTAAKNRLVVVRYNDAPMDCDELRD